MRSAHESSRDGDALLLSARERGAAVADEGGVGGGECADEVVETGCCGGGFDVGEGGEGGVFGEGVGDVLGDGGGEDGGGLGDEGDEGAEGGGVEGREGVG